VFTEVFEILLVVGIGVGIGVDVEVDVGVDISVFVTVLVGVATGVDVGVGVPVDDGVVVEIRLGLALLPEPLVARILIVHSFPVVPNGHIFPEVSGQQVYTSADF